MLPSAFKKLLHQLGLAKLAARPQKNDLWRMESPAQLKIEQGSMLYTMATFNREAAAAYADAVINDIEAAISACTLGDPGLTVMQRLEQLHGLKNVIAATGSADLLKACEQLHREASDSETPAVLAHHFEMLANAAVILVKTYKRTLVH